jgi:type VI protein secretion system component VasF
MSVTTAEDLAHRVWEAADDLLGSLRDIGEADFREAQDRLHGLLFPSGGLPADYYDRDAAARYDEHAPDTFAGSSYFLAVLLDQLFLDSPWGDRWNDVKLEWAAFHSNNRKTRFWEQARLAEEKPASSPRELALVAALLGFRGKLGERPDEFKKWVRRTAAFVEARRQVSPPSRQDEGEPPTRVPPRRERLRRPAPVGQVAETVESLWQEAVKVLQRRRIDLRERRLFLLIGNPDAGTAGLVPSLHGLHQGEEILVVPEEGAPSPFRLLVCDEAIYLLWTGPRARPAGGAGHGVDVLPNPTPPWGTIFTGTAGVAAPNAADGLRHLCKLVAAGRQPFAPVNGIAVLLPWDGLTEGGRDVLATEQAGLLAAARDALGLACPVMAVVCDLERATGYHEFTEALGAGQASRRLGFSLPWLRRPGAEEMRALVDDGMAWLIDGEVTRAVYSAMAENVLNDVAGAPGHNGRLFRFLGEMRERRAGLRLCLARLADVLLDGSDWPLLGGFYFAGTGGGHGEQAFLTGVLQRMNRCRNYLAWRGPEARRPSRAWLAYLLSGAAAVAGAAALLWHVHQLR